jgi:hypothetical protein
MGSRARAFVINGREADEVLRQSGFDVGADTFGNVIFAVPALQIALKVPARLGYVLGRALIKTAKRAAKCRDPKGGAIAG